MPALDDLASQSTLGDALASAELVGRTRPGDDLSGVVAGAVAASDRALLARAERLARSAVERRLVAIASAHLDGDSRRVHDLARDHLFEHPDSVLVAWIVARTVGPPATGPA
jgi:hypothetical protein